MIEALLGRNTYTCADMVEALAGGQTFAIPCDPGVIGNIIRIRITRTEPEVLSLCEVQVYGNLGKSNSTGRC